MPRDFGGYIQYGWPVMVSSVMGDSHFKGALDAGDIGAGFLGQLAERGGSV